MVIIKNTQRKINVNTKELLKDAKVILKLLGYADFDLGIWLSNNKTLRNYNLKYRNIDKATDILSFPYHDVKAGERIRITREEDKNLGDLLFSVEYVKKEAEKLHVTLNSRIRKLLIHGICHLLGYDHIEDRDWRQMRAKEAWLMKKLIEINK